MSYHGIIRTQERAKLTKNCAIAFIEKAWLYGKNAESFSGLEKLYMQAREDDEKRVLHYQGFIFIFSREGSCITMYRCPKIFSKKGLCKYDSRKQPIRNFRMYVRMNPNIWEEKCM